MKTETEIAVRAERKNIRKLLRELWLVITLMGIIIVGGGYLYFYYDMDGITVNRVLQFRDGVDPESLQLVQKEYHRGDMVEYLTNACKTRQAKATSQWTLANDRLIFFAPSDSHESPIQCYPADVKDRIAVNIQKVPTDAVYGEHYFVGVITQTLPDGRIRKQYLQTEKFKVIP